MLVTINTFTLLLSDLFVSFNPDKNSTGSCHQVTGRVHPVNVSSLSQGDQTHTHVHIYT